MRRALVAVLAAVVLTVGAVLVPSSPAAAREWWESDDWYIITDDLIRGFGWASEKINSIPYVGMEFDCQTDDGQPGFLRDVDPSLSPDGASTWCVPVQAALAPTRGAPVSTSVAPLTNAINVSSTGATYSLGTASTLTAMQGGLGPTTLTVDESATDLTLAPSGLAGWVEGSAPLIGTCSVVSAEGSGYCVTLADLPPFGSTGTYSYTVTLYGPVTQDPLGGRSISSFCQAHGLSSTLGGGPMIRRSSDGFVGSANVSNMSCASAAFFVDGYASGTRLFTGTVPAGWTFDHFSWYNQQSSPYAWMYPEGHSLWHPGSAGGLVGDFITSVQCISTTGTSVLTAVSPVSEGVAEIPETMCPEGSVMGAYSVVFQPQDGDPITVFEGSNPDWVTEVPTEFPRCIDGSEDCTLTLWQTVGSQPALYCGTNAVGCPDWWDQVQTHPDSYQCKFGSYSIDLSYCALYREPGTISPTIGMNIDADGNISLTERLDTIERAAYDTLDAIKRAAEEFWASHEWPDPAPEPLPDPDGGWDWNPPPPDNTPEESRECWPSGWGVFNPLSWVLMPLKCAFIPQNGLNLTKINAALAASAIGVVGTGITGVGAAIADIDSGATACGPIVETDPSVFLGETLVVSSCNPLIQGLSDVVRPILAILAALSALFVAANAIALGWDMRMLEMLTRSKGGDS
jgi:hypothetical protein